MPQVKPVGTGLDLSVIVTLDDCPTVRPLVERRQELHARLKAIEEDMIAVRQTISAAESQDDTVAFPVRVARDGRRRLEDLSVEAESVRADLATCTEEVDVARADATARLRPGVDAASAPIIERVVDAMEALLEAQGAMQDWRRRTHRLGMGVSTWGLEDFGLPARLQRARELLQRLRARQG